MGLSKEEIDLTEELKPSASQRRRLRRKKLQAAKAGILDPIIDTDYKSISTSVVLDTGPSKSITQKAIVQPIAKNQVSNDNQRLICEGQVFNKTQNSIFKKTILNNNQEPKSKDPITKNRKASIDDQVLTIKQKSNGSVHDCKNHETKIDNHVHIKKQNSSSVIKKQKIEKKSIEPTFECSNPLPSKKKKSKSKNLILTDSQNIKPEVPVLTEKLQAKSEKPVLTEKKEIKSENTVLIQNQKTYPEHPILIEKVPTNFENLLNENHKSRTENNILIQNQKLKPECVEINDRTKPDNLDINNIALKLPTVVTEIQKPELISQDMGKSKDMQESQKEQELSKKAENTSTEASATSRDDVKAAREAKKLAKQKAKKKNDAKGDSAEVKDDVPKVATQSSDKEKVPPVIEATINKTENKAEKPEKIEPAIDIKSKENIPPQSKAKSADTLPKQEGKVALEVKVPSTDDKAEGGGKSKAELRAERRAKQEAQRAAKQAAQVKVATQPQAKEEPAKSKEEKSPKPKTVDKIAKPKVQSVQKVGWFQHLNVEKDKEFLKNIPINSNLHPAVVKLGVQLASHVVSGSNARCIALLDALKKMVRDYSLPARTEFARGLEAQLTASVDFLCSMRQPTASETNAVKHFRRQLTQLPNNVDEFDAKKKLQEEIDRYIHDQIDKAGEAISIYVRQKICTGDNILTYGCSSLIERILCEAWAAGVRFRATLAGARAPGGARDMLRRLRARGLPASYVDIAALSYVMGDVQKVLLGACSLLANGAVLGAAGGAGVALVARARNVPVLVACETHKFSERVQTDAFVYNEIGDPDDLIDKSDENSPLKDWRSHPNLSLLNLTYDLTPPSLITAVVTEHGILPCTSAPVVLRFKLSEYGI
ncbi:uncharacterized protein [Epargyreus clarus]|uniref:uncharacterized protein isoform X2 n=1 Tax=Epargyreus clarus TaxID=520877 RepID=UPI003C2D410A